MENSRLSRDVDRAKGDIESTLNDLVSEIESLEEDKDKMSIKIDQLESINADLEEEIEHLKNRIDESNT